MRILFALTLAAALLAGCSGSTPRPGDSPDDAVLEDGASAPSATVLRFPLAKAIDTTVWANGTVAFQDTCNTGACFTGTERAFHATDITTDLPAGVPVELTVHLQAQPSQLFGMFDVFIDSPESTFYWYRQETDHAAGQNDVVTLLRPVGTVQVIVAAYAPGGGTPDTPYSLSIGILADPERVSPGAPVGLELGPGDNLTLQAPGQTDPEFLLYGPNDALLGTYAGNLTLPANAAKGEYVVLLPNGSQWGNLSTDNGKTALRALALSFLNGPEGTLPPNGAYDADWDVEGFPLAVGLHAYAAQAPVTENAFLVSNGFSLTLEGPNGLSLESGDVCNICITGGFGFSMGTGTGNPDVAGGTYHVHGDTQASYDLRVMPFALYLKRD